MTFDGVSMILPKQEQSLSVIRGQVAKILFEHAGDSNKGNNRLTQRDIADMLGTSWDRVYISLKSLYHDGIIRIERNRIIINKELIQKAANSV